MLAKLQYCTLHYYKQSPHQFPALVYMVQELVEECGAGMWCRNAVQKKTDNNYEG